MKLPEGWPTEEMVVVGAKIAESYDKYVKGMPEYTVISREIIQAAFAAAPTQPNDETSADDTLKHFAMDFEPGAGTLKRYLAQYPEYAISLVDLSRELSREADDETPAQKDHEVMRLIGQRDNAIEWADKLADAISDRLGVDIGEHSSANNPWQEALDYCVAPAQEDEPVAWRYKSARGFWRYVGNRPNLELASTLEAQPLYTRPDDRLRKAAEEIYGKWKAGIIGSNEAMIELRAALEGK